VTGARPYRLVRWYGGFGALVLFYDQAARRLGAVPEGEFGEGFARVLGVGLALVVIYLLSGFYWIALRAGSFSEVKERANEKLFNLDTVERLLGIVLLVFGIEHLFDVHGAVKAAIPFLGGYGWDVMFANLDAKIHGGLDPWQWTHAIPPRNLVTTILDWVYVGWFGVMSFVTAVAAIWLPLDLRARFFIGYALLWIIAGGACANALGSGGPVYFAEFVGDSVRFSPLLSYLDQTGVFARDLQEQLWAAFEGHESMPFDGISAMPSLHVGVAAYFTFASKKTNRALFWTSVLWTLTVFLGSIHLGWHYAIDGYVGAIIAGTAWWLAGIISGSKGSGGIEK